MNKPNILISACLLGNPVRYDGSDLFIDHPLLKAWQEEGRLISICPEVAGGLSTPRAPAEIVPSDTLKIIDSNDLDVSKEFIAGAQKTLELALKNNCAIAIMTESSPSCGSNTIYDGSFSGTKKDGVGVTTALLEKNGIQVFNQHQLDKAISYL